MSAKQDSQGSNPIVDPSPVCLGTLNQSPHFFPTPSPAPRSVYPPINPEWAKNLPTFSGRDDDFELWWGRFRKIVDETCADDIEKDLLLYQALIGGKASRILGPGCSYQEAKERLLQRYRNPNEVQKKAERVLAAMSVAGGDDTTALKDNIHEICNLLTSLLEAHVSLYQIHNFVQSALTKFPDTWYLEWARMNDQQEIRYDVGEKLDKLFQMMITCEQYLAGRAVYMNQAAKASGRSSPSEKISAHKPSQAERKDTRAKGKETLKSEQLPAREPRVCIFCAKSHLSYNCDQKMSAEKREKIVANRKRCFRCLGTHLFKQCRSNYKCTNCKGDHSAILCVKAGVKGQSPKDESVTQGESEEDEGQLAGLKQMSHLGGHSTTEPPIKVAVLFLEPGRRHQHKVLVDTGADVSVMSLPMAEKLGLEVTPSDEKYRSVSHDDCFHGTASAKIRIGTVTETVCFRIVKAMDTRALLGRPEMRIFGLFISADLKVVQSGQGE